MVNVAVATEGFDLPEVSCVVLARPTMSLALYLQMVGRGLRPKDDGGDCMILDLAGNDPKGTDLPDDEREWSLKPRGLAGVKVDPPPKVRCPDCERRIARRKPQLSTLRIVLSVRSARGALTMASLETMECENSTAASEHDLVCNPCHLDAHRMAKLPVNGEVERSLWKKILIESRINFDPFSLHTLDAIHDQMREVARELVYTSWRDKASFNSSDQAI